MEKKNNFWFILIIFLITIFLFPGVLKIIMGIVVIIIGIIIYAIYRFRKNAYTQINQQQTKDSKQNKINEAEKKLGAEDGDEYTGDFTDL